ncbi:MAG: histidine triad nucleotide-binding protein [Tissierellia bacterium]|nr:histidine triad nucleotide-binding protein [Tissierellia bacterium]
MSDCLFCKIANKEIPSEKIYEDDVVFAFKDIDPKAPFHGLVIPKMHFPSVKEMDEERAKIVGHMVMVGSRIAADQGLDNGFRMVINTGEDGGQTVDHCHLHILGGRSLQWPPG